MDDQQMIVAGVGMLFLTPLYTLLVGIVLLCVVDFIPSVEHHTDLVAKIYLAVGYVFGCAKWGSRLIGGWKPFGGMWPHVDTAHAAGHQPANLNENPLQHNAHELGDAGMSPSGVSVAIEDVVAGFVPLRAAFGVRANAQLLQRMLTDDCRAVIESHVDHPFEIARVSKLFARLSYEPMTVSEASTRIRAGLGSSITDSIPTYLLLKGSKDPELRKLSTVAAGAFVKLSGQTRNFIVGDADHLSEAIMWTKFLIMDRDFSAGQRARGDTPPVSQVSDWEILGVNQDCSLSELKSAYHRRAKELHPDRLEGMDVELKQFANSKLATINAAYERLRIATEGA